MQRQPGAIINNSGAPFFCTILAQEELAISLGADTFIPKPIQRQDFLATLDHQVEAMET